MVLNERVGLVLRETVPVVFQLFVGVLLPIDSFAKSECCFHPCDKNKLKVNGFASTYVNGVRERCLFVFSMFEIGLFE